MYYEAALQFLLGTLKKCGIGAHTVRLDDHLPNVLLTDSNMSIEQVLGNAAPSTVYSFSDRFGCNYIYLRLPETAQSLLLIGPFLQERLSAQGLLALAEQLQLPPKEASDLQHYINGIAVLADDSPVYLMLEQFYEFLWSAGGYQFVNTSPLYDMTVIPDKDAHNTDTLWNTHLLEQRYAMENALLSAVAMGQLQKAERGFTRFSPEILEERTPDTLRNTKNYCIIMNTLLRKAAEQGGVHPTYIDRISTDFAIRIEKLPVLYEAEALMKDMIRSYCLLVQNQSISKYPALVQKAILVIDSDLSADLNLRGIAQKLNVSGSYLTTLFKKETGKTLTAYIISRRVQLAKHLLRTSTLQVQTIAQHCGFPDLNYFSKTFKKLTGTTPKAYRAQQ